MTRNYLTEYENAFADFVGAKAARATSLGRQSLALLLRALDVHEDDKVGICAFTCFSVVEAVMVTGATPVYLDVDEHLCINPDEILKYPKNSLKAVILQHTFGNPGKLEDLINACNHINAPMIEDCAHAIGCYWNKRHLGQFGKGAIFSFEWGKPFTTGQGGMLTVNSNALLSKIDELLNKYAIGQDRKSAISLEIQRRIRPIMIKTNLGFRIRSLCKHLKNKYLVSKDFKVNTNLCLEKGYVRIPDRMTIKEGLKQISKYSDVLRQRRENVEFLETLLEKKGMPKWHKEESADITMLRYPLFVNDKYELLKIASKKGWDIGGWYNSPVHPLMDNSLAMVGYQKGAAVNAERMISQLIHFPTYNISEKKIELIMEKLF
jgi:dTDP-4-amino-4,6-dideoxygalactose transaminase